MTIPDHGYAKKKVERPFYHSKTRVPWYRLPEIKPKTQDFKKPDELKYPQYKLDDDPSEILNKLPSKIKNLDIGFSNTYLSRVSTPETIQELKTLCSTSCSDGQQWKLNYDKILKKVYADGFKDLRFMFLHDGKKSRYDLNRSTEQFEEEFLFSPLNSILTIGYRVLLDINSFPMDFSPNFLDLEESSLDYEKTTGPAGDVRHVKINNFPVSLYSDPTTLDHWAIECDQNNICSIAVPKSGSSWYEGIADDVKNSFEALIHQTQNELNNSSDPEKFEGLTRLLNRLIYIHHKGNIDKSFNYDNRFPPFKFALKLENSFKITDTRNNSYSSYSESFESFMRRIVARFPILKTQETFIEFGNEPEAKAYFWGTFYDWKPLYQSAKRIFHNLKNTQNLSTMFFGGSGFTSRLSSGEQNNMREVLFHQFARDILLEADSDFVSFHIYMNHVFDHGFAASGENINGMDWTTALENYAWLTTTTKKKIISEWNVASGKSSKIPLYLDEDQLNDPHYYDPKLSECQPIVDQELYVGRCISDSKSFLNYLIPMVVFSYNHEISKIYIHALMNYYRHSRNTSLIDRHGNKKLSYLQLKLLNDLIKNGYTVYDSDELSIISDAGRNRFLLHSKKDVNFDFSNFDFLDGTVKETSMNANMFPAQRWVYLERR